MGLETNISLSHKEPRPAQRLLSLQCETSAEQESHFITPPINTTPVPCLNTSSDKIAPLTGLWGDVHWTHPVDILDRLKDAAAHQHPRNVLSQAAGYRGTAY